MSELEVDWMRCKCGAQMGIKMNSVAWMEAIHFGLFPPHSDVIRIFSIKNLLRFINAKMFYALHTRVLLRGPKASFKLTGSNIYINL